MNNDICAIMLDSKHIEWILDYLAGSGMMGELLLRRKEGFVFSEARAYPAQAIGCDFRWGLLCEDACSEAFSEFAADVKFRLGRGNAMSFFRECDFHKNDPCMRHETCAMVYAGDDIMYLLDESSNDEEVDRTIRKANKCMLMCEVCGCERTIKRGDEISYDVLDALLYSLVGIAIGICDDMGICYIPYRRVCSKATKDEGGVDILDVSMAYEGCSSL